ncbi:MAG: EboA domain-containing protein [Flavobacteriaceae bacterium]
MNNIRRELEYLLEHNLDVSTNLWIQERLTKIIESVAAKELYLTYSLLANKVDAQKAMVFDTGNRVLKDYLEIQDANALQIARIYVLVSVLEENNTYFQPKVAKLIQIADTGELETFLKFLVLLPNAGTYSEVAVEALRTNIDTIFHAISLKNPYPSRYFNDQQWNQMYLKAAFMQLDLADILDVDTRANKDLARIISDYAHERWAASRDIDPLFWKPVSNFLEATLLKDMAHLLESDNSIENKAGALCCFYSDTSEAKSLLKKYPELQKEIVDKNSTWHNLKT